MIKKFFYKFFSALLLLSIIFSVNFVFAADQASIDELKKNIDAKNAQIDKLNKEISELDKQVQTTVAEGQTLKSAIGTLDASKNKLSKEILVTQGKVGTTDLNIQQLGLEVKDKENKIETSRKAVADALRDINQAEGTSLVESILSNENVSELWNEIEFLNRFQVSLRQNMSAVEILKDQLNQKKAETEKQKLELIGLKAQLEDQKKVVEINKAEKAKLLSSTQSKEAIFKSQLEEKKRLNAEFLADLSNYESQLSFILDPNSIPSSGKGVLSWPLEKVLITQGFGDTAFSRTQAIYNGKGHNGIDLAASMGTKVMAALGGTVEGTGDTGLRPNCYSYGRWVLIKHDNGFSTLYAHLSLIKVKAGQRVSTGELIAYSGDTGYVTGPHLHFGVYVSEGIKVVQYQSNTPCNGAIIPVSPLRAYLNPLLYLP